jgi:hypothetical protein
MLCCHDKRKNDYSFEDRMRLNVKNHELNDFKVNMYVSYEIYIW